MRWTSSEKGALEATNYFYSIGDSADVLELTFNHDGRTYEPGTGYGHIAIGVEDLDATLASLSEQGIEPERPPYTVRAAARGSASSEIRMPIESRSSKVVEAYPCPMCGRAEADA